MEHLFLIIAVFLQCVTTTESHTVSRCLDRGNVLDVSVGTMCNLQRDQIWIQHAFYSKTTANASSFCNNPQRSSQDCTLQNNDLELTLAEKCNTFSSCRTYIDWLDWECGNTEIFYTQTYVSIDYECVPKRSDSSTAFAYILMDTEKTEDVPQAAHMFSALYAQWSNRNPNHCSLKVKRNVKVTIQVLDLRGRLINAAGSCPYKLYINDGSDQYFEACAGLAWSNREVTLTSSDVDKVIDIVFDRTSTSAEGRLWLFVQAEDITSSSPVTFQVVCGPSIPLHPIPATTTTTTTKTTNTTGSKAQERPSSTTLPPGEGHSATQTLTTDSTNQDSNSTSTGSGGNDTNTKAIIIGVVVGVGCLILIIILITCVMCHSKSKPAERPYRARSGRPISYIDAYRSSDKEDSLDNTAPSSPRRQYSEVPSYDQLKPPDLLPYNSLGTIMEETQSTPKASDKTSKAQKNTNNKYKKHNTGETNYGFDPPDQHAYRVYGTTASYC